MGKIKYVILKIVAAIRFVLFGKFRRENQKNYDQQPILRHHLARARKRNIGMRISAYLALVVAFTTTFSLILPAISATRETVGEGAVIEETLNADGSVSDPANAQILQMSSPAAGQERQAELSETPVSDEETAVRDNFNKASDTGEMSAASDAAAAQRVALVQQDIDAVIYTDWTYTEQDQETKTAITLSGLMPEGAWVNAYEAAVDANLEKDIIASYDINIYYRNEKGEVTAFQPAEESPVKVAVSLPNLENYEDIEVYHVDTPARPDVNTDIAKPEINADTEVKVVVEYGENANKPVDCDAEIVQDVTVNEAEKTVEFTAKSFSIYNIVGTTIEKTVLASDGKNYRITASYGPETGIPKDAVLEVEEITNGSSAYDAYVANTENALGMEQGTAGYIRLFDISIVDKNDHNRKYQPEAGTTVDVRSELADSESEKLRVVHFADGSDDGTVVDAETYGQVVSFAADGFSVYAIVDGDQSTGETYSIKYTFVLDDGKDTPFYFTNKNGDRTNIQYVKDGEIPINPGTPTIATGEQADKEFAGWWTKNGSAWGTELDFNTPVSTSSLQEIKVYARYDNTQYITYYDENGKVYLVDRRHENDTVLTTDVKNSATGEKWTEQELEDHKYVVYQPLSRTTAFLGWTKTKGKTTPDDNFTITEATNLYPVIADVKWVTYHSGPNGSNATYYGAEYALDGNWDRNNLADHIPTRAGYQFDGWYIRNTATQGDDDHLDYSWTVSASDIRVTNASGDFNSSFKNNPNYFENGKLKDDVELIAHWTPTTVDYVFVYYQQEPNANADGTYSYVYKDSRTASGVSGTNTGTPPRPDWDDIAGFSLHNTNDSNDPYNVKTEVIKGDGSTVVNVYYDRNEYTIVFQEYKRGTGYVVDDSATNNVFGWDGTEYVPLTRETHTTYTPYYYYRSYGDKVEYTGIFYTRKDNGYTYPRYTYTATQYNGNNLPPAGDTTQYYYAYTDWWGDTQYDGPLTRDTKTEITRTWTISSTGEEYTGTRFTYVTNRREWFVIDELTITAKYGEDVSRLWPDKRTDLSNTYPQQWYTSTDGSVMQSGIQLMPPNNQVFYNRSNSGTENHMIYWLQDLPSTPEGTAPNTFSSVRNDTIYGNSLETTWDDYSIYEGFKVNIRTQDVATLNSNNGAEVATTNNRYSMSDQIGSSFSNGTNRTLNVYYLRNKYTITFQQGNAVIGSDEYYYEADISDADKYSSSVNVPAGMRFVGWYDNPEGLGEKYNFDGKTMPPNNLILYAKLVPEEYYVRMDYNGGETKGSESTFAWVGYGETLVEPEGVERNYVEAADGEAGTHNYVCWRYDEAADASGDGWWSYYLDADGNVVYNDPKDYSQRTATYVEATGGKYKYDPGKYTFVGWYETDEAGNQISNVPFNFATKITKNTYLKAVFRKEGTFQVRYLSDMGTEGTDGYVAGDPNTAPPTDTYTYIDLSEAKVGHSIEPADKKYQFAGWRIKGTTGPIYQPGETFPINSDYAEKDNEIQYITLEPVFIQKGDTSIVYEINTPTGAEETGTVLEGLTNNTQDKLLLDGAVVLHDGNGFSVTGYKLIGWSDKPLDPAVNEIKLTETGTYEGTIPSDTHIFKLGGKYGVSDEAGNTLYAVWELLTIDVPFTKLGEVANQPQAQPLAGALFELYTDEKCTKSITTVYPSAQLSAESTDDTTNNVSFKIPVGTFYLKEKAAPSEQYIADSTVHKITVTDTITDGKHILTYTIDDKTEALTITNYLKGTDFTLKKTDAVNGESLTGAVFDILKKVTGMEGGVSYREDITVEDSQGVTVNLPDGEYILREKDAPAGYVILHNDWIIKVSDGKVSVADGTEECTVSNDGMTITVANHPGIELPSTGGPGTNLIYLLGTAFIALAGAGFMMRRRKTR